MNSKDRIVWAFVAVFATAPVAFRGGRLYEQADRATKATPPDERLKEVIRNLPCRAPISMEAPELEIASAIYESAETDFVDTAIESPGDSSEWGQCSFKYRVAWDSSMMGYGVIRRFDEGRFQIDFFSTLDTGLLSSFRPSFSLFGQQENSHWLLFDERRSLFFRMAKGDIRSLRAVGPSERH